MVASSLCFLGAIAVCAALPSRRPLESKNSETRRKTLLARQNFTETPYLLPTRDPDVVARAAEIAEKREGILYGSPSLIGTTSFFIGGDMGTSISQQEQVDWYATAIPFSVTVGAEMTAAIKAVKDAGGLTKLSDYTILYDGQWPNAFPTGIAEGLFSNMTSDLLFSMERLSVNPYSMRRLNPSEDTLPFEVDSTTIQSITDTDLNALLEAGRLFYADHSYQKEYPLNHGRYTAACSAYFYLDSRTDQLLPLAIKTGVGADLVYTPLDEENDWILAKIMFNMNDLFHGQIYHLASSHAVTEIVYLPALRTMSSEHPIMGIFARMMYQVYAIRPVGRDVLFSDGGSFDQSFAINSTGVRNFATDNYPTVGAFRSNFMEPELRSRGLLNATYGPELPHFPFYEDGIRFLRVVRTFVESFIDAYYPSDASVAADWELQAWIEEANGPAQVIDFFPEVTTKETLIQLITHVAWLGGVAHHVLNAGEPVQTSGVLPLHPVALYQPAPDEKGVTAESLLSWLPDVQASAAQISLLSRFNRPQWPAENKTLLHLFDSDELLSRANGAVRAANEEFMASMQSLSDEISSRTFGEDGLCQGMPFVWKAMDPAQIPFFMST